MITYTTQLSEDVLLFSLNNNVIEFSSDNSELPLKAEIQIGTLAPRLIYPNPNGSFWFNFKEYINSVLNTNGNADDLDYDLANDVDTIYDWSRIINSDTVQITITFLDDTTETDTINPSWLYAYTSKLKQGLIAVDAFKVLTPVVDLSANEATIYAWTGYPIDIVMYNGGLDLITMYDAPDAVGGVSLSNLLKAQRFYLTDGLNDLFYYTDGIYFKNESDELVFTLKINKVDSCGGYYFKWINRYGGWNYWLFEHGSESLKTKELGEVDSNFNNLSETISITKQIGKESNDTITVYSDTLTDDQQLILRDLFDSPKIYYFTGKSGEANFYTDWLEVSLSNSGYTTKQPKTDLNNFTLTFELPPNDTRKL